LVAGIVGLILAGLGGIALVSLLPTDSVTGEVAEVAGMGFTLVMAVLTLLIGLVFVGGALRPAEAKAGLISIGIALLALGIVVFIEPDAVTGVFGVNETSGFVYALAGLIAAIAGLMSPSGQGRPVKESSHEDDALVDYN
jgi:hypothetical protein